MATAALAGIGGYISAVLTSNFDWPFLPAILVAAASTALIGGLLAAFMVRMRDFILKLTTLAFGEAMSVIAFNTPYIGGANGFSTTENACSSRVLRCSSATISVPICSSATRSYRFCSCSPSWLLRRSC